MSKLNFTARLFLLSGSSNAMLAVILGTFGTHTLKARLDETLIQVYQTANEYHFYHALGLILIGVIASNMPPDICLKISG